VFYTGKVFLKHFLCTPYSCTEILFGNSPESWQKNEYGLYVKNTSEINLPVNANCRTNVILTVLCHIQVHRSSYA
jgi:hypothetical protein